MEYPITNQLAPMILPEAYHQLKQFLLPEITSEIFSLQLRASNIDFAHLPIAIDYTTTPAMLMLPIRILIDSCGYPLAVETFKQCLAQSKVSLCNVSDDQAWTILHEATHYMQITFIKLILEAMGNKACVLINKKNFDGQTALHYAIQNSMKIVQLFLSAAGDQAYTLIIRQDNNGETALHYAAKLGRTEIATLILNVAANNVKAYIAIENRNKETAFDIATPEVKEIMQKYL